MELVKGNSNRYRTQLSASNLRHIFWAEAAITAIYLLNRSPTSALDNKLTPYEAWTGTKPELNHLRIFGCKAYALIPIEKRKGKGKLHPKTQECTFIGYSPTTKQWRLWDPKSGRMFYTANAVFDESKVGGSDVNSITDEPSLASKKRVRMEDSGRVDDEGRPILERVDLMEAFFVDIHHQI